MHPRRFISIALLLLLAACAGGGGSRNLEMAAPGGDQSIVLWNKPSGERIEVTFRQGGHYMPAAFAEIDHIFRDRHTGEEYAIDPNLIELIAGLRDRMVMPPETPIELLSGYRSPETNAMLSRTNKYVAKQSYHMKGMAADIRIPDMNSRVLELVAKTIQRGGVALYPDSGHVHVDTGPVRGWEVVPGFEPGLGGSRKKSKAVLAPVAASVPAPAPAPVPAKRLGIGKVTVSPAPSPTAGPPPMIKPHVRARPVYSYKKPAKAAAKPVKKNAAPPKKAPAAKDQTP